MLHRSGCDLLVRLVAHGVLRVVVALDVQYKEAGLPQEGSVKSGAKTKSGLQHIPYIAEELLMLRGAPPQVASLRQVDFISLGCIRYPKDGFHHVALGDGRVTHPTVPQKDRELSEDF